MTSPGPQRVSAISIPEGYTLPGREPAPSGPRQDSLRQTQFLLGEELGLIERLMSQQLALMQASSHSRYRTPGLAAIVGLWSRAFSGLDDAIELVCRGSYPSGIVLVRAAAELIAAEEGLRGGEMESHQAWLAASLQPEQKYKATDFGLGRYFAGEVLASDSLLRNVYRPASDFGRPNFGATLLQVGPESNHNRLAVGFADSSFHLGWAQLVSGWLIALAVRQLQVIVDADNLFSVSDDAKATWRSLEAEAMALLAGQDRCSVEVVGEEGERRYLFSNFRRSPGSAPKKVLL